MGDNPLGAGLPAGGSPSEKARREILGLHLTPSEPRGVQQRRAGCRGSLSTDILGSGGDLLSSDPASITQPTYVSALLSFFPSAYPANMSCGSTSVIPNTESSVMFYKRHFSLDFSQAILYQPVNSSSKRAHKV